MLGGHGSWLVSSVAAKASMALKPSVVSMAVGGGGVTYRYFASGRGARQTNHRFASLKGMGACISFPAGGLLPLWHPVLAEGGAGAEAVTVAAGVEHGSDFKPVL